MNDKQNLFFSYVSGICFLLLIGFVLGAVTCAGYNQLKNQRNPPTPAIKGTTGTPEPTPIDRLKTIDNQDANTIRALNTLIYQERQGRARERAVNQELAKQLAGANTAIDAITSANPGAEKFYIEVRRKLDEIDKANKGMAGGNVN